MGFQGGGRELSSWLRMACVALPGWAQWPQWAACSVLPCEALAVHGCSMGTPPGAKGCQCYTPGLVASGTRSQTLTLHTLSRLVSFLTAKEGPRQPLQGCSEVTVHEINVHFLWNPGKVIQRNKAAEPQCTASHLLGGEMSPVMLFNFLLYLTLRGSLM